MKTFDEVRSLGQVFFSCFANFVCFRERNIFLCVVDWNCLAEIASTVDYFSRLISIKFIGNVKFI